MTTNISLEQFQDIIEKNNYIVPDYLKIGEEQFREKAIETILFQDFEISDIPKPSFLKNTIILNKKDTYIALSPKHHWITCFSFTNNNDLFFDEPEFKYAYFAGNTFKTDNIKDIEIILQLLY